MIINNKEYCELTVYDANNKIIANISDDRTRDFVKAGYMIALVEGKDYTQGENLSIPENIAQDVPKDIE